MPNHISLSESDWLLARRRDWPREGWDTVHSDFNTMFNKRHPLHSLQCHVSRNAKQQDYAKWPKEERLWVQKRRIEFSEDWETTHREHQKNFPFRTQNALQTMYNKVSVRGQESFTEEQNQWLLAFQPAILDERSITCLHFDYQFNFPDASHPAGALVRQCDILRKDSTRRTHAWPRLTLKSLESQKSKKPPGMDVEQAYKYFRVLFPQRSEVAFTQKCQRLRKQHIASHGNQSPKTGRNFQLSPRGNDSDSSLSDLDPSTFSDWDDIEVKVETDIVAEEGRDPLERKCRTNHKLNRYRWTEDETKWVLRFVESPDSFLAAKRLIW